MAASQQRLIDRKLQSVLERGLLCVLLLGVLVPASATATGPDDPLDDLSLEELMRVPIASASRIQMRLEEAPATVIVIDHEQIEERGYRNLSEVLAVLPGMDFVRPRGATYLKNYWRGFRSSIGSPYLLMLDGTVLNHLYFNSTDVMVALPLSSIDRVEVVYGPASSVYGANAFMGVVHVITRHDEDYATARVAAGDEEFRSFDGATSWRAGPWRFQLAARFSEAELDSSLADRGPYSDRGLLADRRLWGGFLDDPQLAGRFSSPERFVGIDLRAETSRFEFAVQGFQTRTGYGLEYAFDQSQPNAVWDRFDYSVYGRYTQNLSPRIRSTSLLRYRESGVGEDSTFVEGYPTEIDGRSMRVIDFSRWHADNSSVTLAQDFQIERNDQTSLSTGVRFERKDLQKAYDVVYGPSLAPEAVALSSYRFPTRADLEGPANNRVETNDIGLYVQGRHRFDDRHTGHLGVRWDDNSAYGSAITLRAGYVGTFGSWIVKTLFGEGFQEPNPRVLYGGWRGSGSDPELDPEASQTAEVSVAHTRPKTHHAVSLFTIENRDTIINLTDGATNLGRRTVRGLEYHFEALPVSNEAHKIRLWLYCTYLFDAEEERFDSQGTHLGNEAIGDLAKRQIQLGVTTRLRALSTTLTGHWVDDRPTVASNPVPEVDAFFTADLNLRYGFQSGVGLQLRTTNLFDERYAHPGVREASAGNVPGFFDGEGLWRGANGFFSSVLPQPGRQLALQISWRR